MKEKSVERLYCPMRLCGERGDLYKVLPLACIIHDAFQFFCDAISNPIRTALGTDSRRNISHYHHAKPQIH